MVPASPARDSGQTDKSVDRAMVWDSLLDKPRGAGEKKKPAPLSQRRHQRQSGLTHRYVFPVQTAERHTRVSKYLMCPCQTEPRYLFYQGWGDLRIPNLRRHAVCVLMAVWA